MLKKSEVLAGLAKHMSVQKFLAEHPSLTKAALRALLLEAAEKAGPEPMRPVARAHPEKQAGTAGTSGYRMFTDGASRGNPGEAGLGVVIEDDSGHIVRRIARYLGKATNNQAEYAALIEGLTAAKELGAEELSIRADSELMVKQMNGQYKVKSPDLQERNAEARRLLEFFRSVVIEYIPREKNKDADALANEAIDKRIK
jgi:ribonuclease HI